MKTICLSFILMAFMTNAFANHHQKGEGKDHWQKMSKELNLTADQIKKVKELKQSHQESLSSKRDAMKKAQDEFKQARTASASKDDQLAKFDALSSAKTAFKREKLSLMLDLRQILTPEQLTKFESMHKGKHGHGRGKGKMSR